VPALSYRDALRIWMPAAALVAALAWRARRASLNAQQYADAERAAVRKRKIIKALSQVKPDSASPAA
jgi:hypothetical protein